MVTLQTFVQEFCGLENEDITVWDILKPYGILPQTKCSPLKTTSAHSVTHIDIAAANRHILAGMFIDHLTYLYDNKDEIDVLDALSEASELGLSEAGHILDALDAIK